LDRHIESLNYKNLTILNQQELIDKIQLTNVSHEYLNGFDDPNFYDKSAFTIAKNIIKERLKKDFEAFKDRKCHETILVNRSIDHFYNSSQSEIKTSGIERRSIKNFYELELLIKAKCNDVHVISFENIALAEQILIFENAKRIIAQHGAALANIIFCNNTKVIEIIPKNFILIGHFSKLANILGLQYISHITETNHAAVDLNKIVLQLVY
jgi:hypothetical protein